MSSKYFKVTGVDPGESADTVFVWSRDSASNAPVLLGSGHAVRADVVRPAGIATGSYAVTFLLPDNCSPESIAVTGDEAGLSPLPSPTITACPVPAGSPPPMASARAGYVSNRPVTLSQPALAPSAE